VTVLALVPARDEEDRVGETVRALRSIGVVDDVVVVDSGSRDGTVRAALAEGARVLVAPSPLGKGDALEGALWRLPPADTYVFADADLGASASELRPLIGEVAEDRADMAVAVLPEPPTGGFGLVKRGAGWVIRWACGFDPREPLSGQRVLTAACLRACRPVSSGFGVEVGLTIDAVRMGFRVVELPVDLHHRFTRKDLAGFAHRGRQGLDAARAALPRTLALR
jgi:glycosyltransferase involved in cell wall biosynthesis